MKLKFKSTIFFLTFLGLLPAVIFAQETKIPEAKKTTSDQRITQEQLISLQTIRSDQVEFRNEFKKTLSTNQLDILTNPDVNREAKLNAFRQSLSENQIMMISSNRKQLRVQNNMLRSALSSQQRMQIRRMAVNKFQQNKLQYRRARLHNRRP